LTHDVDLPAVGEDGAWDRLPKWRHNESTVRRSRAPQMPRRGLSAKKSRVLQVWWSVKNNLTDVSWCYYICHQRDWRSSRVSRIMNVTGVTTDERLSVL